MKTSASLHLRPLLACLGLLLTFPAPVRAAEAASGSSLDEPLVIAKGKLTRDGKTVPATLHNVLEVVRQRYPDINITVIGVDDLLIHDLTLQWGRYRGVMRNGTATDKLNPPLQGVLNALSEASGRGFEVSPSSDNDFLLRVTDHLRTRSTEVFNLSPFFPHLAKKRELERMLRETEIERAMTDKNRPDFPGLMARFEARIAALTEQLAQVSKVPMDVTKLTNQIREVVEQTLDRSAGSPEFQFHPGTNLLVVTGSDAAVDLTRKVIAALAQNP